MGIFSFLTNLFSSNDISNNNNFEKKNRGFQNQCYCSSLNIESIREKPVVVIAILKNNKLVYNNNYNNDDYVTDSDGDVKFKGPVFKLELSLVDGTEFSIFYGVVTNDRQLVMMEINSVPAILDEFAVYILKEINFKIPSLYNLQMFGKAPTRYAYHVYKTPSYYYITNNRGDDSYYINYNTGEFRRGSRDQILNIMR